MTAFKYFICSGIIVLLATFVLSGCETERYTTKFEVTPFMEDGTTTTEKLNSELQDELRMEDEKRMLMLREKAEEEKGE